MLSRTLFSHIYIYIYCYVLCIQLEFVQQDGLWVHIKSITPDNNCIVGWMDYPENASTIDPQEQQSNYYDQYVVIWVALESLLPPKRGDLRFFWQKKKCVKKRGATI